MSTVTRTFHPERTTGLCGIDSGPHGDHESAMVPNSQRSCCFSICRGLSSRVQGTAVAVDTTH